MSLARFCGKCGSLQNSGDPFCRTCGASLARPQTSSSTGQQYPGTGRQSSLLTGQQFQGTRQQPTPSTGQQFQGTRQRLTPSTGQQFPGITGQPSPSTGQQYPGTGQQPFPSTGQQPFPSIGQQYPGTGRQPPGKILHDRYRLIQIIGQGGMGAVYIAHDVQLGNRLVALKEMSMSRLELQEVPRAIQQFQQEAYLLASLQHPNLPTIYEYFSEDGRWYLVMSYINGQNLQACLDQTPGRKFAVNEAVRISIELCTVLNYLHTYTPQIIFRDLKPLNILMTSTGQIYLIDFGIARHFKADQTRDTTYYYSVGYAAPEQYGTSQTSARSDIYSLGATLHQMLSGLHPANKPFHFAPLNVLDSTIPEPLAKLVAKMVEMDEESRPASVALVKQELEKVLNPSPEPPPDAHIDTAPPARKKGFLGREKNKKTNEKKEVASRRAVEKEPAHNEQVGTPQPDKQLLFPDQQGSVLEAEAAKQVHITGVEAEQSKAEASVPLDEASSKQSRKVLPGNRLKYGIIYGLVAGASALLILLGINAFYSGTGNLQLLPVLGIIGAAVPCAVAGVLSSRASGSVLSATIAGGILMVLSALMLGLIDGSNGGSSIGVLSPVLLIFTVLFGLVGQFLYKGPKVSPKSKK